VKIFRILIFSSLVATGATLAEDIFKNLTNPSVQLGRKPAFPPGWKQSPKSNS
jgi:hypothetical protein